eukprot:CAMPEP_0170817952 /NCGR_PEP_ID=MMETSP0733-20121128/40386_1 /TAXON_ID=186038 /ORGANISM="Fragilariopsis kerguelensis, Strain L26-C5" /LENGTH=132 /DNA_ID=CAMNT_0011177851 /DNA_START=48 /DNA_END=446 /DNA_ORIENTATION=-
MTQHIPNLQFVDASSAPPTSNHSSPTNNDTTTANLQRIDPSDLIHQLSSEFLSSSSLSSASLVSLLESARSSTLLKQKQHHHHHHHQQQQHHHRNTGFLSCGPNKNNGGVMMATLQQLRTEIISNPMNCSLG